MSWLKALDILLKANDMKGNYDKVKKIYDYSKKIEKADPKKLTWDDLKFFNNKTMDAGTKELRAWLKLSKAAEKAVLVWPTCSSLKAFLRAAKVREKYPADSPSVKKAMQSYTAVLKKFGTDLKTLLTKLQSKSGAISKDGKVAELVRDYGSLLEKAFMRWARLPDVTGTSQNAVFFSLSRDAFQYRGIASTLVSSLKRLEKKNTEYVKECKLLIADNQAWIGWATSESPKKDGSMKKNEKAKTPKR